jgi:hypothetical protein
MEEYVFNERYNNEDGLIGDLTAARDLLQMFATSERQFEIVFVRTVNCETVSTEESAYTLLGFDVAGIAPAESTLVDWDDTQSRDDFSLNSGGLFSSCTEAQRYRDSLSKETADEYGLQYVWAIYAVGETR